MEVLIFLVPLAITLGGLGLAAFLWSLRDGQYDDLDGAAWRAIADDEPVESAPAGEGFSELPASASPARSPRRP
jgi:cbb3-type cytochrome oxidase maturation protein